jgi:hypothetical protein
MFILLVKFHQLRVVCLCMCGSLTLAEEPRLQNCVRALASTGPKVLTVFVVTDSRLSLRLSLRARQRKRHAICLLDLL